MACQYQFTDLFGCNRSVIIQHIHYVSEEGEMDAEAVCAKYAQTASDGKTCKVQYFNP